MSQKQFLVQLSTKELELLLGIIRSGKHKARKITRCRILLLADGPNGKTDQEIADAFNVSVGTIFGIRRRYFQEGLEAAIANALARVSLRNSRERPLRRSLRLPAAPRQPVKPNGPCACWPTGRSNSRLLTLYHTKAYVTF